MESVTVNGENRITWDKVYEAKIFHLQAHTIFQPSVELNWTGGSVAPTGPRTGGLGPTLEAMGLE